MRKIVSSLFMMLLLSVLAMAQSRPITGKVVDEKNDPISGASITIKGTKTGVSANASGEFSINAKTGDVLVITAVGAPSKVRYCNQRFKISS